MNYSLEIFYQGEPIEQRHSASPFLQPEIDDKIFISFSNPDYSTGDNHWWVVKRRKIIYLQYLQTLQLFCEPDPEQGV